VLFLLSLVANPEHAVRALQVRRRRSSSAAPSSSSESRTPATISLTVNGKLKISLRDLSAFNPRDRSRNRSSLRGKLFSLQLLSRYALGNRRASSTNIPGSSSGLEGDSSRFPSSSDSALSLSLSLSLSLYSASPPLFLVLHHERPNDGCCEGDHRDRFKFLFWFLFFFSLSGPQGITPGSSGPGRVHESPQKTKENGTSAAARSLIVKRARVCARVVTRDKCAKKHTAATFFRTRMHTRIYVRTRARTRTRRFVSFSRAC